LIARGGRAGGERLQEHVRAIGRDGGRKIKKREGERRQDR